MRVSLSGMASDAATEARRGGVDALVWIPPAAWLSTAAILILRSAYGAVGEYRWLDRICAHLAFFFGPIAAFLSLKTGHGWAVSSLLGIVVGIVLWLVTRFGVDRRLHGH